MAVVPPPTRPAKKTKRVVKIDGIEQEELRQERPPSLVALEKELERLAKAGKKKQNELFLHM